MVCLRLWLVAGNRCLQYGSVGEDSVLDENVGLTVELWGGGLYKMTQKRAEFKKRVGNQKNFKKRGYVG